MTYVFPRSGARAALAWMSADEIGTGSDHDHVWRAESSIGGIGLQAQVAHHDLEAIHVDTGGEDEEAWIGWPIPGSHVDREVLRAGGGQQGGDQGWDQVAR